jgi:Domain of unknown function (DUF4760)
MRKTETTTPSHGLCAFACAVCCRPGQYGWEVLGHRRDGNRCCRATAPRPKQQQHCCAQRASRNGGNARLSDRSAFCDDGTTGEQDPAFRYQFEKPAERTDQTRPLISKINAIGNYYEGMDVLVRSGLVDKELVMQMWADTVINSWERLTPLTVLGRRRAGDAVWENFEYLTVQAQDWIAAHAKGSLTRFPPAARTRVALRRSVAASATLQALRFTSNWPTRAFAREGHRLTQWASFLRHRSLPGSRAALVRASRGMRDLQIGPERRQCLL